MANKLTIEQLKSKKKFHKKRAAFYDKKIKKIESSKNQIGFLVKR